MDVQCTAGSALSEVHAQNGCAVVHIPHLHGRTLYCAKEVLFRTKARIYNRYCGVDITVIPDQFLWQRILPRQHDTCAAEAPYHSARRFRFSGGAYQTDLIEGPITPE